METGNNITRKVSTSGLLTTVAGNFALGTGFSGDGGPASAATFQYPKGLTIDAAGDLFVADYQNWVIRKIDTAGIITTVAGNHLSEFYNGDALPATESGTAFPNYIFVAPSGYLYISNQDNGLIQEMSPNGALIFPSTKIGVASAPESVTISNIGNMPMHFDPQFPSGITGDFALATGGTCDFTATLATGASCNINLTFTPTAYGARRHLRRLRRRYRAPAVRGALGHRRSGTTAENPLQSHPQSRLWRR